jgi:hypothetical protein
MTHHAGTLDAALATSSGASPDAAGHLPCHLGKLTAASDAFYTGL